MASEPSEWETCQQIAALVVECGKPEADPDGDRWLAHWGDFVNIQESECACGDTEVEAIAGLFEEAIRARDAARTPVQADGKGGA